MFYFKPHIRRVYNKLVTLSLVIVMTSASCIMAFAGSETSSLRLSLPYGASTSGKVLNIDGKSAISFSSLLWYLNLQTYGKTGSQDIYFRNSDKSIDGSISPGGSHITVNGTSKQMPFASFYHNNDLFVPLEFTCEALGYKLYWREANATLYIQDPKQYSQANDFMTKSLTAVAGCKGVKTTISNQTSLRYYADTAVVTDTGEMKTDLVTGNAYTYQDSIYSRPISYFSDRMESESLARTEQYVTKNGIYSGNGDGTFTKDAPPPEYISVLDMASKSVLTDWELFLHSAYVSKDGDGNTTIKSETDVGLLLQVGFIFYAPEHADSLHWTNTYQTVTYDKNTNLPKKQDLRFYADYVPNAADQEKLYLTYEHNYGFEFGDGIEIALPAGIE